MLATLAKVFLGDKNEREIKRMQPLVDQINQIEPDFKALSDDALKAKTDEFRERLDQGDTLDDLLPEAFATVREAAWRTLGMRHFDVQLLGGIVLHRGSIAEMRTGEGKTLTATLAMYLNALSGKGAWLVTVNDYLAKRDAEWMGQVYRWLGLTVGTILHGMSDSERKEAYACDITYGTNNEFGFDYLRDNMKFNVSDLAQRGFNYCIVDEVDSVLIDEARTPLIISGPAEDSTAQYYDADKVVAKLKVEEHYTVDEKEHQALFTEEGIAAAEDILKVENLYDPANIQILHCMEQSLRARSLYKPDVDYIVKDGKVIIIDTHTGRPMPGRRYSDGLHQALEAKEGVTIEKENQTLASVTFQNFFRMFDKLSGMTGTAKTEAAEFLNIYKLEVIVLPTNKPMVREDRDDAVYGTPDMKFRAIVEKIKEEHERGRPILVGTIDIDTSEYLSERLKQAGVKHVVLNAKYHAQEAEIVTQAGHLGAVTIATNMAGRGTDIVLGGNPVSMAEAELKKNPEADLNALIEKYKPICDEARAKVLELGGLCILGTERHDSRRIDNQLRGRAGRQGDPGMSQFYLSLEDKLMRLFGSPRLKGMLARNMEDDVPIQHKMVNRAIERAQKSVEARNFEIRKHLLEYDDVMNKQRNTFYRLRRELLEGQARDYFYRRMEVIAKVLVEEFLAVPRPEEADEKRLWEALKNQFNVQPAEKSQFLEDRDTLAERIVAAVKASYETKWNELELDEDVVADHERFILLWVIDQQWKDHMRGMDALKDAIGLRAYAQKDPLTEYKKASFEMFNDLRDRMDEEIVRTLCIMRPRRSDESIDRMKQQKAREAQRMRFAGGEEDSEPKKPQTVRRSQPKVGRNEPCPCGSGKKYKQCHGRN